MILYVYSKSAIFQFTISAKTTDLITIKKDESFNDSISKYIDYFENSSVINNNITQYTADAFKLYKLLHLNKTKAFKNVVIIPDGLLNFIPFESLLTQPTQVTNYSKMPFLIKEKLLAYNTSALFYLNNKPFEYKDLLLGVFPVFKNSSQKLIHSLDEAKNIEKEMNAKFLMYNTATKNNTIQLANNYNILHLSTHANSGDFSSPSHIYFADSKLYLNELYNLI